jgi:hypothetical protein
MFPCCGRQLPDVPAPWDRHIVTTFGPFPVVGCPEVPEQAQLVIPSTGEIMPLVLGWDRRPREGVRHVPVIVREGRWT